MQRRIQITNGHWTTFQSFVHSFEVFFLEWDQLVKSFFSLLYCIGKDHLTDLRNTVFVEEHMLCTAKSDTFSA